VTVLSGPVLTDTPFKLVTTGNVVMLVQTNGVTWCTSDLGANWRKGHYFVGGPGMKAAAVATDPDGVPCQLFVVGETAGGNTMYYMSHIGS